MSGSPTRFASAPLLPLPESWIPAQYRDEAARARALREQNPDLHREWVGQQQLRQQSCDTLHTGDVEYYVGCPTNAPDNCVDRWAANPATADKPAVICEREPCDAYKVTYAGLVDVLVVGAQQGGETEAL